MDPFADLLRRTRDGDPDAFAELFAQFAPAVRQAVHVRGVPKHVRPVADTDDICQSVFIRLFAKLASGEGDFATPDDLRRYLSAMAKHRMIDHHRKRHDATGRPREAPLAPGADAPADSPNDDSQDLPRIGDLLPLLQKHLSDAEIRLLFLRLHGLGWQKIADQLGGKPETQRKRLVRALSHLRAQLGKEPLPEGG